MAEELKELIEKIKEEGVMAGEARARDIEEESRKRASSMLEKARKEAAIIVEEAMKKAAESEESGRASLKQAGRDLLLSVRKELCAMLDKITMSHIHKALDPSEMARIIMTLIKDHGSGPESDIVVSLRKDDLDKLEKGLFGDLRNEIKKGVTLKASDDIRGGFTISYDAGRSYYDFTDKALAGYMAASLRPKLAEILGESSG
jgi:V/A-type H+-transporting ATPase subunit E